MKDVEDELSNEVRLSASEDSVELVILESVIGSDGNPDSYEMTY